MNLRAGDNSGLRKERNFDNHIGKFRICRDCFSGMGEVEKRRDCIEESIRDIRSWKP